MNSLFECLRESVDNEWDVELNTRREVPYLQATTYYFVYHINTIVLHWQEKSTLSTNENKRIDNPRIKIVKIKMKNALKHCKNKHERDFQYKKFSVTDFVVNDRRNLSGTQLKAACGRPPNCRFSFSATRNANTKATEHVTFAFSLRNLVFFPF